MPWSLPWSKTASFLTNFFFFFFFSRFFYVASELKENPSVALELNRIESRGQTTRRGEERRGSGEARGNDGETTATRSVRLQDHFSQDHVNVNGFKH
ncbi:unnamed protein product [Camellia sinensis]